jgi:hypothetical protein
LALISCVILQKFCESGTNKDAADSAVDNLTKDDLTDNLIEDDFADDFADDLMMDGLAAAEDEDEDMSIPI